TNASTHEPAALRDSNSTYVRFGSKAEKLDLSIRCSALPPKADIDRRDRHVRFVPKPDLSTAAKNSSFDNVIKPRKQYRWPFETERLGGREIDEQLNFCGLLDRQIS